MRVIGARRSAGRKGRRKQEIPEKIRRATVSSSTIPKCKIREVILDLHERSKEARNQYQGVLMVREKEREISISYILEQITFTGNTTVSLPSARPCVHINESIFCSWKFYEQLLFLRDVCKHRKMKSDIHTSSEEHTSNDTVFSEPIEQDEVTEAASYEAGSLTEDPQEATTSLPPRRTGFNSRRGRPRIFARGNRAGRSAGILGDLLFPPHFVPAPRSIVTSVAPVGSEDLAAKSRPKIFTPSWKQILTKSRGLGQSDNAPHSVPADGGGSRDKCLELAEAVSLTFRARPRSTTSSVHSAATRHHRLLAPVAPTSYPIRDQMILVPNQDPIEFWSRQFRRCEMNFISISSPVLNSNGATVFCVDLRCDLGSSFEPRWCNRALGPASPREITIVYYVAEVAQWLARSPPATAIRTRTPAGSLPDFRMWGSCWTIWVPDGKPVIRRVLLRPGFTPHSRLFF
ncbi:hypothetical protein PR048_028609 [Dryococelus australis]|uniref:Uncharacterized protein n=1 Tax=Dryococelus australis TaxID=614101 RepID=A0ABQ9GB19_9NEOP|nr:hypothetical protein PR048_028609 [Dryococelus australis]